MVISEENLRQLATRDMLQGNRVQADSRLSELGNAEGEAQLLERVTQTVEWYRRSFEPPGAKAPKVLGINDVPVTPIREFIDGIEWTISIMDLGREHRVPPTVLARNQGLLHHGIFFAYYLWGKEHFPQPRLVADRTLAEPQEWRKVQPLPLPQRRPDPILIGVVASEANRGVWVNLGAWFDPHEGA